jgi:hypothetical protein
MLFYGILILEIKKQVKIANYFKIKIWEVSKCSKNIYNSREHKKLKN